MREIDRLKFELAEAVRNSEEYTNYIYYKNLLAENPTLERSVNELRLQTFKFQNMEDTSDTFEEISEIRRRFEYVRTQDLANDFLNAELCLCRMVQNIYKAIIEDIDFDLDFLQ